jgi:sugar lactone lactonase YvrE
MRLLTDAIAFAESPRWFDGKLWFSDVHNYALKSVDLEGTVSLIADVPGRPAGSGFVADGRLLLATALDRKLNWVAPDGAVSEACDLTGIATGLLNDMVVDGRGRAYVGDIGFNFAAGEAPKPGRVILYTESDGPRVAAEDVVFPNGCAITPDGRHYYVCETLAKRVSRFTIADDGTLVDRSVFADVEFSPDGLCLDQDGGLWVGQPEGGHFLRLAPDGSVDRKLESPAPFAVACVLGGEDRSLLFLCSADTDLVRLRDGISAGRIDVVEVDVAGAGWP